MKKQKNNKVFQFDNLKLLLSLILVLLSINTNAAVRCENLFNSTKSNLIASETSQNKKSVEISQKETSKAETWETYYKKSDLKPNQQLWLRIRQSLEKHVSHLIHPLELAGTDANKIGSVYKIMILEFPMLKSLIDADQRSNISHAEFVNLKRLAASQIISVARKPFSEKQVFAAIEALKYLASIESKIQFPRTKEDIENEKKQNEKDEEKKKKEEQKKKDKKDQEDQPEEEPEWNKTQDKYKPENKDISSDGGGGKKKNVDILLTDADVFKRLLRQKIYDKFDLKVWTSTPVNRNSIVHENSFTKKMIIDPLGAGEVDIPMPYGYTLIPGKYPNYEIKQVGPGEFKLVTQSKDKVSIGLSKIIEESYLNGLNPPADATELAHWPRHLMTFVQSLKGLSAIDAAAKLEKYMSEDGGFLYYSKGNKIDADQLSKIDQKMNSLMQTMPKPMAMANAGAFNCDGAAWIGALQMTRVLGHKNVRIAGGRTSAGTKTIEANKYHVVKSADPAHAWIEVFDGKNWIPFDMTPKNNTPDSDSAPSDVEREKSEDKPKKDQKSDSKDGEKSKEKGDGQKSDDKKDDGNDGDKESDKDAKDKSDEDKDGQSKDDKDGKDSKEESSGHSEVENAESRKIDDIIKAKSTQRSVRESDLQLIDKILKSNEMMSLENLISDGHLTSYTEESNTLLGSLKENPNWKNSVERSTQKISTQMNEAKFSKFGGLNSLVNEIRSDFIQNKSREGKQKLINAQRLLLALSEYRNLTKPETEALHAIQKIIIELDAIKHKNSKEFDVVDETLKNLPGNLSKDWLKRQYGQDYNKLGSNSNINLAHDLTSGKLKPILQMAAVSDFVDMTLNSTPEPKWKEEPTLTRSILPKPRQDLIVTRNPLDFAKMLWNLRPGENMFAPTLQGRQFAMGSLETRRVSDPKNPIERKVSVVYYDISGSMGGSPIETQDALLMSFTDKALSETDAIGRSTHEIYLIPFGEKVYEGIHITSREDAIAFLTKKMNNLTNANSPGTDIQAVIENFYSLISSSYNSKSKQGRDKLFQKANMVLFTDGGSTIDMKKIEEARKSIPQSVEVNMNFVSIGDQVNETLKSLSSNDKLSTKKPMFRQMNSQMINSVVDVSTKYDAEAFATNERIAGSTLDLINDQLIKIGIDIKQKGNLDAVNKVVSEIQITKNDVNNLSGLKELLNLQKFDSMIEQISLAQPTKQRIVQSIVDSYQRLSGRSWKDMTYAEKDVFENMKKWASK